MPSGRPIACPVHHQPPPQALRLAMADSTVASVDADIPKDQGSITQASWPRDDHLLDSTDLLTTRSPM